MPSDRRAALPRAVLVTLWGNACLSGATTVEDSAVHAVGGDALHRVLGVPGEDDAVPLAVAFGRLRAAGVTALRLVLPEPGDPVGLPGPPAVTADATAAGEVVMTVSGPGTQHWALLPTAAPSDSGSVVRWDVREVPYSVHPHGLPTLSEAERALAEAVRETTSTLASLDLARGRDDVAGRLAAVERAVARVDLPPSLPSRAQRSVVQAARLLGILDVALATDGAAVTAAEMHARAKTLRPLRAAARHALCAACSAEAEPEPAPKAWRSGR